MSRDITHDRHETEQPQAIPATVPGTPEVVQPLSREREAFELRGYQYQISASEMAALGEIGRFRTIATNDLATYQYRGRKDVMRSDLESLAAQGLLRQRSVWTEARGSRLEVVVLTKTGRQLLEARARAGDEQVLYSGLVKAREIAHDAAIYRMFQVEAERIVREGGRIRRIILDYELKQKLYRPLAKIRPQVSRSEYAKKQAEVAAQNNLKVVQGKILLPDLRIEFDTRQGTAGTVDLELATHHYRGAAMRGKAQAGFKIYAPGDAASALAAAYDPEFVAEIFSF